MRPGENGELIIEGQTEARIVSHYFTRGGVTAAVLNEMDPPIEAQEMNLLEFAGSRIEDLAGTSGTQEHVVEDPRKVPLVAELIGLVALPSLPIAPPKFGRRAFLQKRFNGYVEQLAKQEQSEDL